MAFWGTAIVSISVSVIRLLVCTRVCLCECMFKTVPLLLSCYIVYSVGYSDLRNSLRLSLMFFHSSDNHVFVFRFQVQGHRCVCGMHINISVDDIGLKILSPPEWCDSALRLSSCSNTRDDDLCRTSFEVCVPSLPFFSQSHQPWTTCGVGSNHKNLTYQARSPGCVSCFYWENKEAIFSRVNTV